MPLQLNSPPLRITLTKDELQHFFYYVNACLQQGFTGMNHYDHKAEREWFIRWHLVEVQTKTTNTLMRNYHAASDKKLYLRLNEPERHTMAYMFQRVDCDAYVLQMQPRFTTKLTPIPRR